MKRNFVPPQELAEQAFHIEIDLLKEPVGKQDQYISAFGGITCFEFLPDDTVIAEPLKIAAETLGESRGQPNCCSLRARRVPRQKFLRDQDVRTREDSTEMLENLHLTKQLGHESRDALVNGDLAPNSPELMHVHWEHKKKALAGKNEQQFHRRDV